MFFVVENLDFQRAVAQGQGLLTRAPRGSTTTFTQGQKHSLAGSALPWLRWWLNRDGCSLWGWGPIVCPTHAAFGRGREGTSGQVMAQKSVLLTYRSSQELPGTLKRTAHQSKWPWDWSGRQLGIPEWSSVIKRALTGWGADVKPGSDLLLGFVF